MDVVTLPLPPSLRSKLLAAGHHTTASLLYTTPSQLVQEAKITNEEAHGVLKLVPQLGITLSYPNGSHPSLPNGSTTSWELLKYEKERRKIVTYCSELDKILGGGICSKEKVMVDCGVKGGVPGVGKTQFSMQLAINVQIPKALGGVGGHTIYIDTEGSFMLERVIQMTEACIADLMHASPANFKVQLNVEDVLGHIYLIRVHDPAEQLAVVNTLPKLLEQYPQVKLVVFDSVTFTFREDFEDMALRTRLLADMAQKLMAIAEKYDLAIVLTNQVTHKATIEGSKMVPALGSSWSHACTNRLMIYWEDGQRYAHLVKSPSLPSGTAPYDITEDGVRDSYESNKRLKLDVAHDDPGQFSG